MTQNLKIGAGEVLVFTDGSYSDYGINGYAVSTKSFDLKEEAHLFRKTKRSYPSYCEFIPYLIAKELLVPVAHREIHLGSYNIFNGDFEIEETE